MKKMIFLLFFFCISAFADLRYLSKTTPDETTFDTTTTPISTENGGQNDDYDADISLGFDFPFNGQYYNKITIDINGRILLDANESDPSNDDLSDSNTEMGLYPYWDDLYITNDTNITYDHLGSDSDERFAVTWDHVQQVTCRGWRCWASGAYTFQAVLYRDGRVRFRYLNDDDNDADGSSATIGVKEDDDYYDQHLKDEATLDQSKDILYTPTTVSGTIYEDPNGDSQMGDQIAKSGVSVYLYDSSGALLESNTTDSSGAYRFYVPVSEEIYVSADSVTVSSDQSLTSGNDEEDIWVEQTYGGIGAQCADGNGGTAADRTSAGSCFGGRRGDVSDAASTLDTSEHRIRITTDSSVSSYTERDFGFSFNVVTGIRDGDDDSSTDRTVQGSLRQFIQNANALSGSNSMRFVPSVSKNGIGADCWQITLSDDMNETTDSHTVIDGTAYSLNDGITVDNSNSGSITVLVSTVGTGSDGIESTGDEHTLPSYDKTELEIDGGDNSVFSLSSDDNTIRYLSIYNTPKTINVSGENNILENLLLGTRADGSDPGSADHVTRAITTTSGATGTILRQSYFAYVDRTTVIFPCRGEITENYFISNAASAFNQDAITLEGNSAKRLTKVWFNYIDGAGGYGIESWYAGGGFSIENNTITNTGSVGSDELGGVRIFGVDSNISYNIITNTNGAGIAIVTKDSNNNARNLIHRNAIYSNPGLSIDLDQTNTSTSDNPDGDGVTPNDGVLDSSKQNNDMDYPIMTKVTYDGSTLHIEGFVGNAANDSDFSNAMLEVYIADDDGNNDGEVSDLNTTSVAHGEGKTFLFECTSDGSGNFDCDYSDSSFDATQELTMTATLNSEGTSEFGPNHNVVLFPNISIVKSSMILNDPVNGNSTPKRIPGATLRYCFTVDNTGEGDAEDATVSDSLTGEGKEYLTYLQSGSLVQDISTACDCAGITATNGTVSGDDVTIVIGDINGTNDTAHSRGCAYIEITIQ